MHAPDISVEMVDEAANEIGLGALKSSVIHDLIARSFYRCDPDTGQLDYATPNRLITFTNVFHNTATPSELSTVAALYPDSQVSRMHLGTQIGRELTKQRIAGLGSFFVLQQLLGENVPDILYGVTSPKTAQFSEKFGFIPLLDILQGVGGPHGPLDLSEKVAAARLSGTQRHTTASHIANGLLVNAGSPDTEESRKRIWDGFRLMHGSDPPVYTTPVVGQYQQVLTATAAFIDDGLQRFPITFSAFAEK